jgi:hypothetical protein
MFILIPAVDYLVGEAGLGRRCGSRWHRSNLWTVSDALWAKVEPLIRVVKRMEGRQYQRKPGAGRSAVLWKALPREFGSASAVFLSTPVNLLCLCAD